MPALPVPRPVTRAAPDAGELDRRLAEILAAHVGIEGRLLPILHDVQAEWGHVPQGAVPIIAKALNLTAAEVHGVVTFYHDFRDTPTGRHELKLCRAEACQSMGGAGLAELAKARLGVDWHGTSEDGAVTLEPVYCLGLCATAPAAMLDGELFGRLDRRLLEALIAEARA